MRYPEKYTALVVLAGALLSGLGAARVLSDKPQPWRRTVILLAAIVLAASSAAWLPVAWAAFVLRAVLMAAAATAGVLAVHALAARQSVLASPLLVAVVAFDLAVAAWPLLAFSPRQVASEPSAAKLIHSLDAPGSPPPRVYRASQTDNAVNKRLPPASAPELESRLLATLITNTVNAWGIATLPGYDAAIPSLVDQVWSAGLDVGQSALRLLGASYVVLPVEDPAAPDERVGLTPLADPLPGARLYRVQNALPRVFWAARAEVVSDKEALTRLYQPDVVAGATVLLASDDPSAALSVAPGRAGECQVESFANQRVVAVCNGHSEGFVTFIEQYDSGWSATVDGQSAPLLRASVIMRALRVQPGTHRIVLEYHTPRLRLGAAISLGCLLLLFGLVVFGRKSPQPGRRRTSR
jgi:Bacterial membrane protein YfhO